MKNRLTKITTKKGDSGFTTIATGESLLKSDARIEAIGSVDELNAAIGMLVAQLDTQIDDQNSLSSLCKKIQSQLFDVGGDLAMPDHDFLSVGAVTTLESAIESINSGLPPLKDFVIPGQCKPSAAAHFSRCVARRAERRLIQLIQTLSEQEQLSLKISLVFLNRLSDLLFVMSRQLARSNSTEEPQWQRD